MAALLWSTFRSVRRLLKQTLSTRTAQRNRLIKWGLLWPIWLSTHCASLQALLT